VLVVMIVVVVVLTIATLFITALSSSYATLAERVDALEQPAVTSPLALSARPTPVATGVGGDMGRAAPDLHGRRLDGEEVDVLVGQSPRNLLLAFLSSGCSSCGRFWAPLVAGEDPRLPSDTMLVVLTKGPDAESLTALEKVADGVSIVMSTAAWVDYEIPGTPFFVFIDAGSGTVQGEGTALGWDEVRNLIALGRGDASIVTGVSTTGMKPSSDAERESIVDQVLMDAGIFPGDASLYPGSTPPPMTGAEGSG